MLKVYKLNKYYKKFHALKDVSLNIGTGRVFCLIGPNGSGKSTFINCILSMLKIRSGEIIYNESLNFSRVKIGLVSENECFLKDMTVYKNLLVTSVLKESTKDEIETLLERFDIEEIRNKLVRKLSLGQKKRLAIANSLVGDPSFIIWDEPFNALDPLGFVFLRQLVFKLKSQGKTLLICTHLLDEVQRIADDIGLMYKGRLLSVINKEDLNKEHGTVENYYLNLTRENNN